MKSRNVNKIGMSVANLQNIQTLSRHFTQNHKFRPHGVARGKVRGITEVDRIRLGTMNACTKSTIPQIVIEIFQSGTKSWTDLATDIADITKSFFFFLF